MHRLAGGLFRLWTLWSKSTLDAAEADQTRVDAPGLAADGDLSMASGRGEADDLPSLDEALPREMLVLMIAQMTSNSDVKNLSLTSRFFFSLVRSPELIAAWLWERLGNSALIVAMVKDDMAVFRQLIEVQRANVNSLLDGFGPALHAGSFTQGRLAYVTYLLSVPGIQVNLRENSTGNTALHFACEEGHQAIVHQLLQHPAVDINTADNWGNTAWHLACLRDNAEIVAELLGHPDIDVNETFGPTARTGLHLACGVAHATVVTQLLKHPSIRVNQRSVTSDGVEGFNALLFCLAAEHGFGGLGMGAATLQELLKHPGLDRGDMKEALQIAQSQDRLSLCAKAIVDALQ